MKITVIGLGYVGLVQAACLAAEGHQVVGVDFDGERLQEIAKGNCPVSEAGLAPLLAVAVQGNLLTTSNTIATAIVGADAILVCVGTPPAASGEADLSALRSCLNTLRDALDTSQRQHTVIIRSTLPIGTMRSVVLPSLAPEVGGKTQCLYVPEFLREGCAIKDYRAPQKILIGCDSTTDASDDIKRAVEDLYGNIFAPRHYVPYELAELAKYADNYWHALKVCFANEIATLASNSAVDGRRLMEIFRQDKVLNVSGVYLKPGMPFGGSCLEKDVSALHHHARGAQLQLPLLASVNASNAEQLERSVQQILATGAVTINIHGIAFKAGTDDLRNSPALALVLRLVGAGKSLRLQDDAIAPLRLQQQLCAIHPELTAAFNDGRIDTSVSAISKDCDLVVMCHAPGAEDEAKLSASGTAQIRFY